MHIVQLAYQVTDAKAAALEWATHHGAGPFFLSENIPLEGVHYKGAEASLDHTSAYGWCGNHMIELVQQNCDTPSVFKGRANGLHHCAYFTPSLKEELGRLEKAGYSVEMSARTSSGIEFAFALGRDMGHYFEIYQDHAALRSFYAHIETSAQNWDGTEPLRAMH